MEKTYKRIPFNIELAKNIQSGEIEGKIVCRIGCPARILCTDFNDEQGTFTVVVAIKENPVREKLIRVRTDGTYSAYESDMDLFIELPEETPNLESISKYAEELAQKKEAALERWYKSQEAPKRVFHPFDKVVVRENNNQAWRCDVFSHMSLYDNEKYRCIGAAWTQCIPYEGNEHLVGTTDKPKED